MARLVFFAFVGLLELACSANFEGDPAHCSAVQIDDAGAGAGERLVVACNEPIAPLPASCTAAAAANTYECNTVHASDEECAAFPGLCK